MSKLMDWQKKVVYGAGMSLAVPAPARSGKNYAIVDLARNNPYTLIVEPTQQCVRLMSRELSHAGVGASVVTSGFLSESSNYTYRENANVVVFNELQKLSLLDLLQFRDRYHGRIIVMGTPRGIPCPIFYPLSKMPEWKFVCVSREKPAPYITEYVSNLSKNTYCTSMLGHWC